MSTALDTTRLAAARLLAADRTPYFSAGLFALTPVASPGLGTFAVDRRWHLYVDPDVVDRWTVPQVAAVLVHELYHVLREHAERGAALGVGPENARPWNVACDAEINDDLVALGLELPPTPVLPDTLGAKRHQLAEAYYAGLPEVDVFTDCGSGAHGQPRAWERDAGGLEHADAVLVRRQVAGDVQTAKRQGRLPKGIERWADSVLEERVDWRRALAAEVRRAVSYVAGRVDYTYRRPSRRSAALSGVVLPSFARPVPSVAIVVDTSGSMDQRTLGRCLSEIDAIVTSIGLRTIGVPVLACDAAVHAVTRVVSAERAVLVGGGGTDMGAGLAAAHALRPRPEVVVVLTDGHTPWPDTPPSTRVVVALLGSRHAGVESLPDWVRAVVIDR
jgi:predicted metal-dependent peptidase